MPFELRTVSKDFVLQDWKAISILLQDSFANAKFNDNYDIEFVLNEIKEDCSGEKKIKNLLLYNKRAVVIGGIFSIPSEKTIDNSCSVGWYFTSSSLKLRDKILASDLLINSMHKIIKDMGYISIETEIGTQNGENILVKRYGYQKLKGFKNRWIKEL